MTRDAHTGEYVFRRVDKKGSIGLEITDSSGTRPNPLYVYPMPRSRRTKLRQLPDSNLLPSLGHSYDTKTLLDTFIRMVGRGEHTPQVHDWVETQWTKHELDVAKDKYRWPLFFLVIAAKLFLAYIFIWKWDLLPKTGMRGYPIAENLIPDLLKLIPFMLLLLVWPPQAIPSRLRRTWLY